MAPKVCVCGAHLFGVKTETHKVFLELKRLRVTEKNRVVVVVVYSLLEKVSNSKKKRGGKKRKVFIR